MAPSLAERIAALPRAEREEFYEDFDITTVEYDKEFWLRPEQIETVSSEAWITAMLAGRGAGKTRVLSEWVREKARTPNKRIALLGRTVADVRDTMVQGQSGIMAVHPPSERPEYTPSLRRLLWPNGSMAMTFSAEEPSQLRGPQFHYGAVDELAAFKLKPDDSGLHAWDQIKIACRLGAFPQLLVATTPKRTPEIRALVDMAKEDPRKVSLMRGATTDNLANLSAAYIEMIVGMYRGTSIERQELFGELLAEIEGALWKQKLIDDHRLDKLPPLDDLRSMWRIVGVDPSVAEKPGDECGIVVIACTPDKKAYNRQAIVLDDLSMKGSPDEWAKQVVAASKKWNAVVVAEKNQGHALVRMAIQQQDATVPVALVNASQGKAIRAEPIVMGYEQGRVHHGARFPLLEDEMTSWVPGESGYSPNRMDALVWGLSAALVDDKKLLMAVGTVRAQASQLTGSLGITPPWRRNQVQPTVSWRRR